MHNNSLNVPHNFILLFTKTLSLKFTTGKVHDHMRVRVTNSTQEEQALATLPAMQH